LVNDRIKRRSPPYVSYKSFLTLLEDLRNQGVPARLDRSYWGEKFSGSTGTQLISALRFLELVDGNGLPSPTLRDLVKARSADRGEILKRISHSSFVFLKSPTFAAESATYSQLEEVFKDEYGVDKDVARKCIKFFVEIIMDAGITLSPYITKKSKSSRQKNTIEKVPKHTGIRTNPHTKVPHSLELIPHQLSWKELLLSKFPSFDPGWPNDVQLKWFEAFDELLKRGFISSDSDH
jgi:hypothetical protein